VPLRVDVILGAVLSILRRNDDDGRRAYQLGVLVRMWKRDCNLNNPTIDGQDGRQFARCSVYFPLRYIHWIVGIILHAIGRISAISFTTTAPIPNSVLAVWQCPGYCETYSRCLRWYSTGCTGRRPRGPTSNGTVG
jgi:hypothetical protein